MDYRIRPGWFPGDNVGLLPRSICGEQGASQECLTHSGKVPPTERTKPRNRQHEPSVGQAFEFAAGWGLALAPDDAKLNPMTDERDSLELAWRGSSSDDLPLPPPLRISGETALFLDFDGTLVEIAARPDLVKVARALPALLNELGERLGGRLAIISGRALEAMDRLLGPIDVAMAGSHGGEFRPAAGSEIHPLADPLPESIAVPFARFASDNGELLAERKPFSMAVHYRGRPEMHEPLLAIACPTILYPYAREAISDLVTRGGFPPVLLAPVSFEALYAQRMQQQAGAGPRIEVAS